MKSLAATVIAAMLASGSAARADTVPSSSPPVENTQVSTDLTTESLTNDRGYWNTASIDVQRTFAPRSSFYAGFNSQTLYDATDPQYLAGAYIPVSSRAVLGLDASWSPTHQILPASDFALSLEQRFAHGWGTTAGLETRAYTSVDANIAALTLDRYTGPYRFAYRISAASLNNVPGEALTHDLIAQRWYGESSIGLDFEGGRDVENTGSVSHPLLVSGVAGVALYGRHWVRRDFGVDWRLETYRLGHIYTRNGGSIGVRYRS